MKITVRNPVQHDGVYFSEGRHDVDEEVGKALVSSGTATDGWTEEDGALSQAGTQSPPGRASASEPAEDTGTQTTRRGSSSATEAPDKTTTGQTRSKS